MHKNERGILEISGNRFRRGGEWIGVGVKEILELSA
jgi:hypothetical protein